MPPYKMIRGKGPRAFGEAEWYLSVNWVSLATALVVASVTWVGTDLLPVLQQHGVLSSGLLGALTALLPIVLNWFKDNSNIQVDKKL